MTWEKNALLRDKIKKSRSRSLLSGVQALAVRRTEEKNLARAQDGLIHGSEVASANWCPRETFYRLHDGLHDYDLDVSVSPRLAAIFDEGSESHRKWQDAATLSQRVGADGSGWLLRGDWLCLNCREVQHDVVGLTRCPACESPALQYDEAAVHLDGIPFVGHADLEMEFPDGAREGVEIKTVSIGTVRVYAAYLLSRHTHEVDGKRVVDLKGIWDDIREPFPAHVRQANLYGYLRGWRKVHIWYEYKPDQATRDFILDIDESLAQEMLTPVYDLADALASPNPTPPPRPEDATTPSAPLCKGCPAQKACWFDDTTHREDDAPEHGHRSDAGPATGRGRTVRRRAVSPIPTDLRTS